MTTHPLPRVVIVGGGVIGTLHAWIARRHGWRVVHLERDPLPMGATVRNFGLCWLSGRSDGPEFDLARRARDLWEILGRDAPGIGFRANGSLTLAATEGEERVIEAVAHEPNAADRGVRVVSPEEARRLNPTLEGWFRAAMHCTLDAAVESRRALSAIREYLLARDDYEWCPGTEVDRVGDQCVVDRRGRTHHGDLVVLAAGAEATGAVAEAFADPTLQRVRLHMAETAPWSRAVTTAVADGYSLRYYPAFAAYRHLLEDPDPALAARHIQLLAQQRLDGGVTLGDTHEYDEPFGYELEDAALELIVARARAAFGPNLPPLARRWTGVYHQLRRVTDDQLYYRRTVAPGVVAVGGAGGRGMTLAPAIAEETFA